MGKIVNAILSLPVLLLLLFLTVILLLWPVPAKAGHDPVCGNHADLIGQLEGEYGQVRIGVGIGIVDHKNSITELLVSPMGTWAILVTFAGGEGGKSVTCLVAVGKTWERSPAMLPRALWAPPA